MGEFKVGDTILVRASDPPRPKDSDDKRPLVLKYQVVDVQAKRITGLMDRSPSRPDLVIFLAEGSDWWTPALGTVSIQLLERQVDTTVKLVTIANEVHLVVFHNSDPKEWAIYKEQHVPPKFSMTSCRLNIGMAEPGDARTVNCTACRAAPAYLQALAVQELERELVDGESAP